MSTPTRLSADEVRAIQARDLDDLLKRLTSRVGECHIIDAKTGREWCEQCGDEWADHNPRCKALLIDDAYHAIAAARADLTALCASHEEMREELEDLKAERYGNLLDEFDRKYRENGWDGDIGVIEVSAFIESRCVHRPQKMLQERAEAAEARVTALETALIEALEIAEYHSPKDSADVAHCARLRDVARLADTGKGAVDERD